MRALTIEERRIKLIMYIQAMLYVWGMSSEWIDKTLKKIRPIIQKLED